MAVSKAQFGAVSRYANLEINNAETFLSAETLELTKLQTSLAKLSQYQSRITDLSNQLLTTIDEDNIEAEVDKHEKLKADILDAVSRLEVCIGFLASQQDDVSAVGSRTSGFAGQGQGLHSSVKLPKLNIPPFEGDPLKFHEFWDAFESTIHSNESLSPIEKLNYLRSYLRGAAKNPIAGYSSIAANYDTVVSVLKQRFGNKKLIIYNHLDSLISLPPTGTQVSDLQRTTDECERHIRSLVNLGLEEETFGRVFVPIIMSKLPIGIRISLHKYQEPGHCWTLTELRQTLHQEIYAREMGTRSFGTSHSLQQAGNKSNANQTSRWKNEYTRQRPATASTLTNSTKLNASRGTKKCSFCGQDHYSTDCRRYPDSQSRRKALGERCFNCLGNNHTAGICRSTRSCFYCKSNRHHSSLCIKQFGAPNTTKEIKSKTNLLNVDTNTLSYSKVTGAESAPKVTTTVLSNGKRGILQTAVADISGTVGAMKARILFDNGASNAFITTKAATCIGAKKMGKEIVALAGFQDKKRKSTSYTIYEIGIGLLNGTVKKICAYGTEVITSSIERHLIDTQQNPLLAKVQLADPLTDKEEEVEVDLLLGSDYYYEFVKAERITLQNGIILLDSELGYIVAGRLEGQSTKASQLLLTQSQCPDSNFDLERLWKLEEVGIAESRESEDDEIALKKFNDTTLFNEEENRYYVKWPVKEENPELPTNFKLAYGRLKSLLSRLRTNPPILQKYHETIKQQQETKMVELAPSITNDSLVHYMPHHGVLKPNKATTKLRIVYDASSKISKSSLSLNECMHRGPVMLHDLCGLMVRFRTKPIAIVSDVEKAFLQIGLHEPDRDLVRFLWLKDPGKPISNENILHYRFRRVCFGVVASPFLLAAVISHHLQCLNTPVARDILDNIYVDNIISGADSSHDAVNYYRSAKQMFSSASMNIREWYSNSAKFMQQIPANDRGEESTTQVLGMKWDTTTDQLSLTNETAKYSQAKTITKRVVLRSVAKLFDPCGYFAPVTLPGKFLLQQLWQNKYAWDEPIPDDIGTTYSALLDEWKQIPEFKIPRLVGIHGGLESARVELHGFCDASMKAYSAAFYLKTATKSYSTSNLIFAKARVSPLKTQSIPRLELTAVFAGTKLSTFLEKELKLSIQRKVLWTDSQCALHWILGKPVSTRFVKNRVTVIKQHKNIEFRYVPTNDNPADLPTRGTTYHGLSTSRLWWKGPSWLTEAEDKWPTMPYTIGQTVHDTALQESVSEVQVTNIPEIVSGGICDTAQNTLLDIRKFSTLEKAVTVIGYVKRFCKQISKKVSSQ